MLHRTENPHECSFDLLIVDDSTAIRKILQRVLHTAEIPLRNVYEAGDGIEALAIMKANSVSLILSDINMPNMDGLQLLGHIRANEAWEERAGNHDHNRGSQVKVIEAVQLGATGYVRKPSPPIRSRARFPCFRRANHTQTRNRNGTYH